MADLDPQTWHRCLDEVRDEAMEYFMGRPMRHPDVGAILTRLRARCPRPEVHGELDTNPARVAARRIEARRG